MAAGRMLLPDGRMRLAGAQRSCQPVKALIPVGATSGLQRILKALRSAGRVDRIIVVGPKLVGEQASGAADMWIDERASGEDNAFAGLQAVRSAHALLSASDLPFVNAAHINDFLQRIPAGADFAYPIYERAEFLAAFPGGRSRFAQVADRQWTGGSICLVNVALAQRQAALVRKAFRARKNLLALASLFGAGICLQFVLGKLVIEDIERRLSSITGGAAHAIRHAHPALAMDCDDMADVEYARLYAEVYASRARDAAAASQSAAESSPG